MKNFILAILILCGVTALVPVLHAQSPQTTIRQPNNTEKQQFRLAQRFMRNRDYGNAIRVLENLYRQIPGYQPYYRELFTAYLQLSLLQKATDLIERQSRGNDENMEYRIDRANILFRSGEKDQAQVLWQKVLKDHGDNVRAYTMTAAAMLDNRLFDETINVYRAAYKQHPDKHFLLRDIAGFYRRQLNFTAAIRAYIEYIRKDPANYQFAIRQVMSFQLEEPQIDSLAIIIDREMKQKGDQRSKVVLLAAKFYQNHRRFSEALNVLLQIDDRESDGRYLYDFARSLQTDEEYAVALGAYEHIIKEFSGSKYLLQSYLGAASCNLELAKADNDQEYARKSLAMINVVRKKHPNHPQIGDLTLLEGDIHRQFFFDLDLAAEIYLSVTERFSRQLKLRESAYLKAGETQLMRGDLEKARVILANVKTEPFMPQALMLLARADFYDGKYENAGQALDQILKMEGLSGPLTNDVLNMQSRLALQAESPEALRFYAEADWLKMQRKLPQALSSLRKVLEANPPAHFRIEVLLEAAQLAGDSGQIDEALAFCEQILKDQSMMLYADQALFSMAEIVENHLKDFGRAYRLYDQVLRDYSGSPLSNAARDRLKAIRQSHPEVVDETAM